MYDVFTNTHKTRMQIDLFHTPATEEGGTLAAQLNDAQHVTNSSGHPSSTNLMSHPIVTNSCRHGGALTTLNHAQRVTNTNSHPAITNSKSHSILTNSCHQGGALATKLRDAQRYTNSASHPHCTNSASHPSVTNSMSQSPVSNVYLYGVYSNTPCMEWVTAHVNESWHT